MGIPRFLKIFAMLLLVQTYCDSQPVEFLTEPEDASSTICPEELAKKQLENVIFEEIVEVKERLPIQPEEEKKYISITTEAASTICPEEIERQKQEEKLKDERLNQNIHAENAEETTICPEELEKRKLEKQAQQLDTMAKNTDTLEKTTTIDPEEVQRFEQNNEDGLNKISKQTFEDNKDDDSLNLSRETTTICPEELERLKQQKNEEIHNRISEITLDNLKDINDKNIKHDNNLENTMETTICPEELERIKQEKIEENSNKIDNKPEHNNVVVQRNDKETFDNFIDEGTTICPKELARKKLEQSQIYLTKFKELVDQAQKRNSFRRKRQVADYSSYYSTINTMNQPTYNSDGLAMSASNTNNQNSPSQQHSSYNPQTYNLQPQTAESTNQNLQSQKPQTFNSQAYNPQTVKTYQQLRKQYQQPANTFQKNPNFYPKPYQNNVKPVKTYRNPSTYVRYPSNGSLNNYYRLNNSAGAGNRRQFQGARPASTSARPNIRVTRKKKFKPSPVFA